ncbi:MAG: hypothetical protein IAE64_00860 [Flavobacteriales bacterium]|nr:MAG: hypothetical protein F9K28_03075 [Bacteroidota bacterium]KXK35637.1 MAG: PQ loop repeat protein [Chlorobi bacterium OLB6]MBE2264784.1 hypothetical protein [Flavobacteriales bacterium]MBV6463815.1 Sugar transporter SemiSWEET [Chlorobiota bacterium]MBW7853686.1 hypothetical protein [Candidatus Kapabacteria bacterium]MCC6332080.1 hypothetical protein [Ignavibacteria bacterium]
MDPTIIGLIAGTCSTFALAPQAWKVYKTGLVSQLSLKTLILMVAGVLLWLTYGILVADISILWANGVASFFVSYLFLAKMRDIRRNRHSK